MPEGNVIEQSFSGGTVDIYTGTGAGAWPLVYAGGSAPVALTPNGTFARQRGIPLQTGNYVSAWYVRTFNAYQWMRLPAGVWIINCGIRFTAEPAAGDAYFDIEPMDNRLLLGPDHMPDFWYYLGYMSPPYFDPKQGLTNYAYTEYIGVSEEFCSLSSATDNEGDGMAVSFWMGPQACTIHSMFIQGIRIAPLA